MTQMWVWVLPVILIPLMVCEDTDATNKSSTIKCEDPQGSAQGIPEEEEDLTCPSTKRWFDHQFQFMSSGSRGFWEPFTTGKLSGETTKYPNATSKNNVGPYCVIRHSLADVDELVGTFDSRDFSADDLIFLKIKTYSGDKSLEIRTGMEKYIPGTGMQWHPYPFVFLKEGVEGKYKFLPIRLHQFADVWSQNDPNSLRAENFLLKKPFEMEVRLNISGQCWDGVPTFFYKGEELIGGISEWSKEAIIAHLLAYLTEFTTKCLTKYGGMWRTDPYNTVCYAKRAGEGRYSVPYVLEQCCRVTYRTRIEILSGNIVPIECDDLQGSVRGIRVVVYYCIVVIFLFLPLMVRLTPSKPEPYKRIKTPKPPEPLKERNSSQKDQGTTESDKTSFLLSNISPNNNGVNNTNVVDPGDITVDLSSDSSDNRTAPKLVKEGVHFKFALPDRMFLDSDPEFHLNLQIALSYLFLCNMEYYVLIMARRILFIYSSWFAVTVGLYFYGSYYSVLLDSFTNYILFDVLFILYIKTGGDPIATRKVMIFMFVTVPIILTVLHSILLAPLVWRKQSMSQTLLQNGNLKFFGNPFPESLVRMRRLRKSPKLSAQRPAQMLLQRNLIARLENLAKLKFWKLWWINFVCVKGSYWQVPFRLPVAIIMVAAHSIPVFSSWSNCLRCLFLKITSPCCGPLESDGKILSKCKSFFWLFGFLMFCTGILLTLLGVWLNLIIYSQFFVFLFIDILRNASDTLPKCIVIFSIIVYIKMAFDNFEDAYRSLKEIVLDLCKSYSEEMLEDQDEESEVVLIEAPHEPLYVKTNDGEVSIPRRVFYDVCEAYLPYKSHVAATFTRLSATFFIVIVLFFLIMHFQIMSEFSEVGETFLTICTVSLPSMFGLLKSDSHLNLSNRRRDEHILAWLAKITTVRPVSMGGRSSSPKRRSPDRSVSPTPLSESEA